MHHIKTSRALSLPVGLAAPHYSRPTVITPADPPPRPHPRPPLPIIAAAAGAVRSVVVRRPLRCHRCLRLRLRLCLRLCLQRLRFSQHDASAGLALEAHCRQRPARRTQRRLEGWPLGVGRCERVLDCVETANVGAANGIAHTIDAVIDIDANLAVIAGDNNLNTLVTAASAPQCADVLTALTAPASRLTVFAPIDAAFTAFFAAEGITATVALELPELPTILLGHTVQGVYTSADLMAASNTTLTTLAGTSITITYDSSSGTITVTPAVGGSATVAITDVGASNGIAHAITAVLDVST